MNKGKESYNNIPLPDSLSASIQKGLDRGKRYTEKKWITGFGSLAASLPVYRGSLPHTSVFRKQ